MRFGACMGISVHIIEPAGFATTDRAFRRAGMDYLDHVHWRRHVSFDAFQTWRLARGARLLLATTKASRSYLDVRYEPDDIVLFGRESAGVPQAVHFGADQSLMIPMQNHMRSLNVALAVAMISGEALRQTDWFSSLSA